MSLQAYYRKHEQEKNHARQQRILKIEHSTYTPLVLSATDGIGRGKETATLFEHLASKFAQN